MHLKINQSLAPGEHCTRAAISTNSAACHSHCDHTFSCYLNPPNRHPTPFSSCDHTGIRKPTSIHSLRLQTDRATLASISSSHVAGPLVCASALPCHPTPLRRGATALDRPPWPLHCVLGITLRVGAALTMRERRTAMLHLACLLDRPLGSLASRRWAMRPRKNGSMRSASSQRARWTRRRCSRRRLDSLRRHTPAAGH